MNQSYNVLTKNNDLPIRTDQPVHFGKVRSVYWLTSEDSQRLIQQKKYDVAPDALLAVMIISDRISAFDCIWNGVEGLKGVPGKGAALNAISSYWFDRFRQDGLACSHILDTPHPFVWIVQRAEPVMIEAIGRQYITGSMWRSYEKGERNFCGIQLPEGLKKNQKLSELLITPSSKGILKEIPGVPEVDDVNITRSIIEKNYSLFNFKSTEDISTYEYLLQQGFNLISQELASNSQIFVDTKFEFGYVRDASGNQNLIYMDEVGTPDSSRIWDSVQYQKGNVVENSKEGFRQFLLDYFSDSDVLLNQTRMSERLELARQTELPKEIILEVSKTYTNIARNITGRTVEISDDPRSEIIDVLSREYDLINS